MLKCQVCACNTLEICPVIIQNEGVVGYGLEILKVVGISHIGNVLASFECIVGHYVPDEEFGIVGALELPHQRSIGCIDDLNGSFFAREEVLHPVGHRPVFGQPSGTGSQSEYGSRGQYNISAIHNSAF